MTYSSHHNLLNLRTNSINDGTNTGALMPSLDEAQDEHKLQSPGKANGHGRSKSNAILVALNSKDESMNNSQEFSVHDKIQLSLS